MTTPEAVLVAKLTTAIGRVDAGSVGGYEFRRHVAKTDLLPLVQALLREQAEEIAAAIDGRRASEVFGPIAKGTLGIAAEIAREIGAQ